MVEISLLWTVRLTVACLKLVGGWGVSIIMVILYGKFASSNLISMEFLHLFLRCHFAGKPLVASQPRSQGSLLPALLFRRAGRREPWEQGWRRKCWLFSQPKIY